MNNPLKKNTGRNMHGDNDNILHIYAHRKKCSSKWVSNSKPYSH